MKKTFCILLVFTVCFSAYGQTTPVLKFREGSVWVTGLGSTSIADDQWKEMLKVFTHEAFVKKINQPVAGTYTRFGDSLSFTPDFRFAAGRKYHALFGKIELGFTISQEKLKPTKIEAVHPQAEVLPENMLRMYIAFSGAMMPGEAYDHITLLRENGTRVDKAFLIIDQELWNTDRTRFTLLFDPGRVKRGIQSNVELGAPLQSGQTYRLVIDSAWRDAHGNSLAGSYTKSFTVREATRTKVAIPNWKITAPTAGTQNELLIEFDRPLDYALALKSISIMGAHGKVNGRATFTGSYYWRFTPDQPWLEDEYYLEVNPELEDVAGNNFNNVFDIDLSKECRSNSTESVKYPVSIRSLVK